MGWYRENIDIFWALKFQANLPDRFWDETIQTTCYLTNRLPTPLLSCKSPYELLYRTPPNYLELRVFGYLCYPTNLTPKYKFDSRAHCCIFMGYPTGQMVIGFMTFTNKLFQPPGMLHFMSTFFLYIKIQQKIKLVILTQFSNPLARTPHVPLLDKNRMIPQLLPPQ